MYPWDKLPGFYRSLDVYLCAATIEGVPMPPLEAMACGVPVVIPWDVGMLNELPGHKDIYRYKAGDLESLLEALQSAVSFGSRDPDGLRAAVSDYSIDNWREGHARAFARLLEPLAPPAPAPAPPARPPAVRVLETDCGGIGVPLKTDRGI